MLLRYLRGTSVASSFFPRCAPGPLGVLVFSQLSLAGCLVLSFFCLRRASGLQGVLRVRPADFNGDGWVDVACAVPGGGGLIRLFLSQDGSHSHQAALTNIGQQHIFILVISLDARRATCPHLPHFSGGLPP